MKQKNKNTKELKSESVYYGNLLIAKDTEVDYTMVTGFILVSNSATLKAAAL